MDKLEVLRTNVLWNVCDDVCDGRDRGAPRYTEAKEAYDALEHLDMKELRQRYVDVYTSSGLETFSIVGNDYLGEQLRDDGTTIFEGAQGVLLDENFGFHPHTTGSTTTFANADDILTDCGFDGEAERVGVMRCYMTRHGQGPLVTEIVKPPVEEEHNKTTMWAGAFRVGYLDMVALRYALEVCGGVDTLAISHRDQWEKFEKQVCTAYIGKDKNTFSRLGVSKTPDLDRQEKLTRSFAKMTPRLESWSRPVEQIQEWLQTRVGIVSQGPMRTDKTFGTPGELWGQRS